MTADAVNQFGEAHYDIVASEHSDTHGVPVFIAKRSFDALQAHEIERVGSSQPTRIDVRIVAATNQLTTANLCRRRGLRS